MHYIYIKLHDYGDCNHNDENVVCNEYNINQKNIAQEEKVPDENNHEKS